MIRLQTRLCLSLLCLLIALLGGCKQKGEDAPEATVAVEAAHPTRGPITERITADAILAPLSAAALSPRLSAPILAEYVTRGAHVRRGQLLLSLDDRDLKGNALDGSGAVASAEASLTAATETTIPEELKRAELDVLQLKAALDVASRTAQEREALYKQGALSGRDADTAYAAKVQAQTAYDLAREHEAVLLKSTRLTDKQAAQGQLTSAQGRLENAEAQLAFTRIRSPIDGVVTDRPLFPGETAAAGTPVITVMDTSSLLAKLHLADSSAQKLTLGGSAKVSVPGIDEPLDAVVSLISPALDPGSTTVEVWLKLSNSRGLLKVGSPVHAVIEGEVIPDAVQVPASAIVPGDDGGTAVMVVGSDGTVKKRLVSVGVRTTTAVQIVSGISLRDTVVTQGGYGLDDGTRVSVRPGVRSDGER